MLAVLVQRDDLNGNVTRVGILLQLAEHRPAKHVGQEHVEGHRRRVELPRQGERVAAPRCHQHLETVVARQIREDAGVVGIVLDDQQRRIARLDLFPIVGDDLRGALRLSNGRESQRRHRALRMCRSVLARSVTTTGPMYRSGRYRVNVLPTPGALRS